jgi:HSP20 family protein
MATKKSTDKKPDEGRGDMGGGIFSSLTDFIGNFGDLAEAGERLSRRQTSNHDTGGKGRTGEKAGSENRFGRILSGLTDIAEKLSEISEKGETVTKKGEFIFPSKEGGVKGIYGFSLKTGLGATDDAIKVEPFGNIRKDKKTGEAVVQEIHEPLIDVFEDEDATTLIAEMPGVGSDDIKINVRDDVLTISAVKGAKKYRKEVLLGHSPANDMIKVTCNNGIVTIRCEKAG